MTYNLNTGKYRNQLFNFQAKKNIETNIPYLEKSSCLLSMRREKGGRSSIVQQNVNPNSGRLNGNGIIIPNNF